MKYLFFIACFLVSGISGEALAQRKKAIQKDTLSVVVLRPGEKGLVDSTALKPETRKRRRRFGVKVVPAPPPTRSWQEIRYSDSLGRRP